MIARHVNVREELVLRTLGDGARSRAHRELRAGAERHAPVGVGRHELDVRRRAAALHGQRRDVAERAARRRPSAAAEPPEPPRDLRPDPSLDPLHQPGLLAQLVVDLRAQLAAHDGVRDAGGEQHGNADRQCGRHRHPPPQRHQVSRRT